MSNAKMSQGVATNSKQIEVSTDLASQLAEVVKELNLEHRPSVTIEQDKSNPPTPDGSGRPTNFDVIMPGLYRSSFPSYPHFQTLADLELKTIITFVDGPLDFAYANFISSNSITHHHIHVKANKDEDVFTDQETIHQILDLMLDPENYPMLIHCNKGKHRTGCVSACFRRVTGWSTEAAIEEYVRYSYPKDRELDKAFITRFDPTALKPLALERRLYGQMMLNRGTGQASTQSSLYTAYTNETNYSDVLSDVEKRISEDEEMRAKFRFWNYR